MRGSSPKCHRSFPGSHQFGAYSDARPLRAPHDLRPLQKPEGENHLTDGIARAAIQLRVYVRDGGILGVFIPTEAVGTAAAEERPSILEAAEGVAGEICRRSSGLDVSEFPAPVSSFEGFPGRHERWVLLPWN